MLLFGPERKGSGAAVTALRAAVVGAGPVGRIHARALAANPSAELVAVCGRTPLKTEELAARHGVGPYLSVQEMMRSERPDVVCICTGNADHADPTLSALEHGAHVFVEKPLAMRVDEAAAMVTAARGRGLQLGVNFNHRFSAPYSKAHAFVDQGRAGSLAYVTMKFAGSLYKVLNDPYCHLIETQGHSFDLMRLFAGEVEQVSAFFADPRNIGVYTSAAIAMSFSSGAVGTLLGSWDSSYDHPEAQSFELCGLRGRVVVENIVDAVRFFDHDTEEYTEWRPGLFDSQKRDFWATIDAHIDAFLEALVLGKPPPVSGEDGLKALELTFAAIRSFEERTVVSPSS
jgi:predicted dehydrogenase